MSDIITPTSLPIGGKAVNQINIRNKHGTTIYNNVDIMPTASSVLVEKTSSEGDGQYSTLQDFLFAKFYDTEIEDVVHRVKAGHYPVNVNATSIWQAWNDYQNILKKRLVGIYDDETGYQGDYILTAEADSINATAIEKQKARYALTGGDEKVLPSEAIAFIIERYGLKDDYIPSDSSVLVTAEEQAEQMLLNFGSGSLWQRVLDEQKQRKDELWGIYKDGELVGHFEDTRENIDALKDVYGDDETVVEITGEGGITQEVYAKRITTDDEALALLVDLQEKSIYQHLIDLKDFWISLPVEYYLRTSEEGVSVANKYDIEQLRTSWTSLYPGSLEYVLNEDGLGYAVTGLGDYAGTTLIIPDTYNELPVTAVANGALKGANITSLSIGNNITSIGSEAFMDCAALNTISIGNCVTHIGEGAFTRTGYFNNDSNWENKVLYIGKYLIDVQSGIRSHDIKDGTTVIADSAFEGEYYFYGSSSTIPNSVTHIGENAFTGCYNFQPINIPDSVVSIGRYAFSGCIYCRNLTIGAGITNIEEGAFYGLQRVTTLTIPDTVVTIGKKAFSEWYGLRTLTIGNNVMSIGDEAFNSCSQLRSVVIPNSVKNIGSKAFNGCSQLLSVTIGESVMSIGDSAFAQCPKLIEVVNKSALAIAKGSDNYGLVAKNALEIHDGDSKIINQNDYLFYTYEDINYLLGYVGTGASLTLPINYNGEEEYSIYSKAFKNNSTITSVTISSGVTDIGTEAFYECDKLTNVTMSNGVQTIGQSAFRGCGHLSNVIIANSVTTIGQQAFYDTGLTSLIIPNSVATIQKNAFADCGKLDTVRIGNTITSIENGAFATCPKLTNIYIDKPEGLVLGAPWGATNATVHWNTSLPEEKD